MGESGERIGEDASPGGNQKEGVRVLLQLCHAKLRQPLPGTIQQQQSWWLPVQIRRRGQAHKSYWFVFDIQRFQDQCAKETKRIRLMPTTIKMICRTYQWWETLELEKKTFSWRLIRLPSFQWTKVLSSGRRALCFHCDGLISLAVFGVVRVLNSRLPMETVLPSPPNRAIFWWNNERATEFRMCQRSHFFGFETNFWHLS